MTTINRPSVLPIQQKIFSFTTGLTAAEFLAATPALAKLLRQRLAEVRVPTPIQEFFVTYPDLLHFALLVSEDAPETPIILPIWMRVAQLSPRFSLRIFRDTDNLNLLNQITDDLELGEDLTEVELPLCLLFDEEWNYQTQWGPHPQAAEPFLDQWFEEHGEYETLAEDDSPAAQRNYALLIQDLIQQMRVWYNSELDRACLQEIRDLLASLREEDESDSNLEEE
ncbi:MAG: thioredoxin family protein [Caldilineaceae bacterium]